MSGSLAVLVVEDTAVLRAVVSGYLDAEADLQVVASVASGNAALAHVRSWCPDVILLDNEMADGSGLEVLGELRQRCPRARIVMFSASDDVRGQALAGGADRFVGKDLPLHELADSLRPDAGSSRR